MNRPMIFILLACASLFSCNNDAKEKSAAQSIRPVKYIIVGNNNMVGKHNYTGLAKAQEEANLSFKVGGTIQSIPVKVGDRVRKGQILATLDPTDYQVSYTQTLANVQSTKAQIESAKAQLESAKANHLAAEANYKRFEKLYETNSISISDFEQAKSTHLGAEASYRAAQTQVAAAKASNRSSESTARSASNQVNYTKITAPFAGIITKIEVEPNEVAGQGNPVIEINSESSSDVEVGVPENTITEIQNNQNVIVQFNSISDRTFKGVVHEIGYSSAGTTYPVTIRLTDYDKRIRPGMPANVNFTLKDTGSSKSSLLVPPGAVGEDSKGNFVYVVQDTGEQTNCKKQTIQVGKLSDAGFEVLSGLNHGDKVASAGLNVLRDGMQVSLFQKK